MANDQKGNIAFTYRPFPGLRMPTDFDLNIPISVPIHPALAARTICVSLRYKIMTAQAAFKTNQN